VLRSRLTSSTCFKLLPGAHRGTRRERGAQLIAADCAEKNRGQRRGLTDGALSPPVNVEEKLAPIWGLECEKKASGQFVPGGDP